MVLNNVSIVTILAVINRKGMKNNSLVFYDPQIGEYIGNNLILQYSRGMSINIIKVDNLLMDAQFVSQILRAI